MNNDYGVVEVYDKQLKKNRLIKYSRFNPEIHKQIGDVHSKEYAMYYDKPVHLQQDEIGRALIRGQDKANEAENMEKLAEVPAEASPVEAENVEVPPEKEDSTFDASVELPIEEVEKLKMWQMRKYAKHRGIEVLTKSTKVDLVAQVRSLLSN